MSRRQMWNDRYAAKDLVWSAEPNQLFAEQAKRLQPATALDVACGEGRNAIWLAQQGWSVTAIDFSEVAIGKANQVAEQRGVSVTWMAEDISTFVLPQGEYDLVAVLYLHTDPAERATWLPNVAASVKPTGTFIYIGHDPSNIKNGVGGPQNPELLPGITELSAALQGFNIDEAAVVERPVASEPGHGAEAAGIALDSFIRASRL